MPYMVCHLPSIYPGHVSIYSIHTDPSWVFEKAIKKIVPSHRLILSCGSFGLVKTTHVKSFGCRPWMPVRWMNNQGSLGSQGTKVIWHWAMKRIVKVWNGQTETQPNPVCGVPKRRCLTCLISKKKGKKHDLVVHSIISGLVTTPDGPDSDLKPEQQHLPSSYWEVGQGMPWNNTRPKWPLGTGWAAHLFPGDLELGWLLSWLVKAQCWKYTE